MSGNNICTEQWYNVKRATNNTYSVCVSYNLWQCKFLSSSVREKYETSLCRCKSRATPSLQVISSFASASSSKACVFVCVCVQQVSDRNLFSAVFYRNRCTSKYRRTKTFLARQVLLSYTSELFSLFHLKLINPLTTQWP